MEGDLGLHLWKDSRDRRGYLREWGHPSVAVEVKTRVEDHSGTEVSVGGGPTGYNTRHGAGASYLGHFFPRLVLASSPKGCSSSSFPHPPPR